MDKEVLRRVIRGHIGEVKECYERELAGNPELGGRIAIQFTIAATGQVVASVLQHSTLGNPRTENCVVQAVRRWEFPKPVGGGIVIVTYPFNFTPSGNGADTPAGRLAPEHASEVIRSRMGEMKACYERHLQQSRTGGRIDTAFTIGTSGTVTDVHFPNDSVRIPEVTACISQVIRRLQFTPPTGGPVDIHYPILFAPSSP